MIAAGSGPDLTSIASGLTTSPPPTTARLRTAVPLQTRPRHVGNPQPSADGADGVGGDTGTARRGSGKRMFGMTPHEYHGPENHSMEIPADSGASPLRCDEDTPGFRRGLGDLGPMFPLLRRPSAPPGSGQV